MQYFKTMATSNINDNCGTNTDDKYNIDSDTGVRPVTKTVNKKKQTEPNAKNQSLYEKICRFIISKKIHVFTLIYIAWCFAIYASRIYVDKYCENNVVSLLIGSAFASYDCVIATTVYAKAITKYHTFWVWAVHFVHNFVHK